MLKEVFAFCIYDGFSNPFIACSSGKTIDEAIHCTDILFFLDAIDIQINNTDSYEKIKELLDDKMYKIEFKSIAIDVNE